MTWYMSHKLTLTGFPSYILSLPVDSAHYYYVQHTINYYYHHKMPDLPRNLFCWNIFPLHSRGYPEAVLILTRHCSPGYRPLSKGNEHALNASNGPGGRPDH